MASVTDEFAYDLFLSFRGEDTRYGFTGNLWKALNVMGIHTFIDDEELQKGDEITPALVEAIGKSRMAIVVLSKNYASSSFCLRELSEILDSIRNNGRPVWPIFYDVDPSDVRKLTGTYGEAMAKHEAKFNHNMGLFQRWKNALYQVVNETRSNLNMELLQKWKNALYQVSNLTGFHYKNRDGYEHEFIDKIVEQVLREIKPVTLPVGDCLVGLESKKREVKLLLDVGSDDRVHMVGIYGIGGIGKTTLALTVYNLISRQFQASCFLEKVRENSEKRGLEYLQNNLLSQIVGEKKAEIKSVKEGMSKIHKMLHKKKVLLLLDDVDNKEQLDAIAGNPNWFGLGSRVLITTRNKRLLICHGVESTYDVTELNKKDSFELVSLKAFKTAQVTSGYTNVVNRVVAYASGHPLALEVIGSHFFNKTVEQCESALDRYERVPHQKIQTILQVSYDALEEEERIVFLDIACCFRGHKLPNVEKILHAHHGDNKKDHITVLAEKSLIKISESNQVTLHDLIEDMGKEIVRQESPEEPGKRSRLWSPKDILGVLKANMGTSVNQIIYLDSNVEVECNGQAFKAMKNLKTLIVRCDRFSEYPKHLPSSLRVLQWNCSSSDLYPSSSSDVQLFDFRPKELVICEIDCTHFTSIVSRNLFNQEFENMRVLVIERCSLTHFGNISGLSNLEQISCRLWKNLNTIDDSMGVLVKLKVLHFRSCEKLTSFPRLMLGSLEELVIAYCENLESVPSMNGSLGKLKILKVEHCSKLKSIPPLKLPLLETLDLSYCSSLKSIPPMSGFLDKLKMLRVERCYQLKSIPPLKLPWLEELQISLCSSLLSIQFVGDGSLDKLKIMRIERFIELTCIPPVENPSIERPIHSDLDSLESIPLLGDLQKHMSLSPLKLPSLVKLYISYCGTIESISSLNDWGTLKILEITSWDKLKSIPPLNFPSLVKLSLSHCISLESIPPLNLPLLKDLNLLACFSIESIPSLMFPLLESLSLCFCKNLESIDPIDGLMDKLKSLNISRCSKLRSIPPLKFPLLQDLNISFCENLESIPLLNLPLLQRLDLSNCESLKSIAPFDEPMEKLVYFNVRSCRKLTSIPPLNFPLLGSLELSFCDRLESFPEISGVMENITHLDIYGTPIKELPSSFQNFTRLQSLTLKNCGKVKLHNSIIVMSKLARLSFEYQGCIFPKKYEDEEKGSPMQSSRVEYLFLWIDNLSDESLAIGLKWFSNVKELDLSGSYFTTLPECIGECPYLWKIDLNRCKELREVKRIPPSLKTLSIYMCKKLEEINGIIPQSLKTLRAFKCKSLTTMCKRELLNEVRHEAGNTNFFLPHEEIPEWFDHTFKGEGSISFWFRNEFPAIAFIALCVASTATRHDYLPLLKVIINGNAFKYKNDEYKYSWSGVYHLHLFHMQMENFNDDPNKANSENEWNHAEIEYQYEFKAIGMHVLRKEEEEDVRFSSPYIE